LDSGASKLPHFPFAPTPPSKLDLARPSFTQSPTLSRNTGIFFPNPFVGAFLDSPDPYVCALVSHPFSSEAAYRFSSFPPFPLRRSFSGTSRVCNPSLHWTSAPKYFFHGHHDPLFFGSLDSFVLHDHRQRRGLPCLFSFFKFIARPPPCFPLVAGSRDFELLLPRNAGTACRFRLSPLFLFFISFIEQSMFPFHSFSLFSFFDKPETGRLNCICSITCQKIMMPAKDRMIFKALVPPSSANP